MAHMVYSCMLISDKYHLSDCPAICSFGSLLTTFHVRMMVLHRCRCWMIWRWGMCPSSLFGTKWTLQPSQRLSKLSQKNARTLSAFLHRPARSVTCSSSFAARHRDLGQYLLHRHHPSSIGSQWNDAHVCGTWKMNLGLPLGLSCNESMQTTTDQSDAEALSSNVQGSVVSTSPCMQ